MSTRIEYYFSLNSPWSFLGHARIVDLATRAGAELVPYPTDFSVVFPQTGGLPVPKRAPARQAYRLMELERWAAHLGIPLNLHPAHWPADEALAAGMVIAAAGSHAAALQLAAAFMQAVWVQERNIADEGTMLEIATEQGMDGPALLEDARGDGPAQVRQRNAQTALERGVFGAPSYVIDSQIFWGQDRLDFVARALGLKG